SIRDRWAYYTLRDVQTEMPYLLDREWNRRREYTQAEMLAVRPGGDQTLLIARAVRNPVYNDVAQRDEQVSRTFVIALDEPAKAGKTYRLTAESGRLIEGTTFRPAWRPYRGLEGEVTVLGVSDNAIRAAVRVTGLTLEMADPDRALRGVFTFKTATGAEPELQQAQVNFLGEISMELPRLESAQ
ncbi:MAG: hypothetical protein KJZ47_14325, partial [Gemmatimonadales bacterium]|nr:hypothetical protein [Gemmatimonadales bacterium]